jgi:hypothetical protein
MMLTDKIIFVAAIILFWRGWSKGILRTIFGPLALIVCSVVSYSYYLFSRDIIVAAAIGIVAPIVLNIIFSILLNLLSNDKEKNTSLIGRVIAALLNMLWGGFIIAVILFTILMIPFELPSLIKAKQDIEQSASYSVIKPAVDKLLKDHHVQPIDPAKIAALSDPKKLEEVEKTAEYQALINDARIQSLLTDPVITDLVERKEIAQLMKNPKILELTRDPELLKKFLALYSKMLSEPVKETPVPK